MQNKTTHYSTLIDMVKINLKTDHTTSAGEDVEQVESSEIAGEMKNGADSLENSLVFFKKYLPYRLIILLLSIQEK